MSKNNQKPEEELKGNRKEDLDRLRGMRRIYNPESGPANK